MEKTTLNKSLTRQIALFVIVMMVLVICAVGLMMTNTLKKGLIKSMAEEVLDIEEALENYLSFQRQNISSLTKNHFIINSLVDTSGREVYLATLMDGFIESRQVTALTVVDFEGKVIRSNMEGPPDYLSTSRLRICLDAGRSIVQLSTKRQRIIFIEPILFYQTPQGAVVMEVDLGMFAERAESYSGGFYFRLLKQGKVIFENRKQHGEFLILSHTFAPDSNYLTQLGLSLEIGTPKSSYTDIVKEVIAPLVLLAIVFILVAILLAVTIAKNISKPILTLCQRVRSQDIVSGKTYESLNAIYELEELADIFERRNVKLHEEIEKRREADRQTALSYQNFKTVMDSVDALVYVADMETFEVLFINKYGQDIWGEITGKTCWSSLQSGQDGQCPFCNNNKLLDANGQPAGVLVWELQNTSNQAWYQCRDQAIRWTDGHLVRMEIAVDITRQKEVDVALADEKERLAVTLRSIGDGVITTETSGKIVLLNNVAEKLTGWSEKEAIGKEIVEVFNIINQKTRLPCENPVDKVLASKQIVGLANHTALIARDGKERSISDSGAPIRDKDNQIIGVVVVFRDVTETLKIQKQLLKSRKLESVGILAGGIAHDFNNILTAILGNINLALLDDKLEKETRSLLAESERASIRAKDLTVQLLTFAKGGDPVKETASMGEIIRDSADFILRGSDVTCRYDMPEDLRLAEVDKSQFSQVIQNIVLNAKQAMPTGGTVEISCENVESPPRNISVKQREYYIRISIKDTGIGLKEEVIDSVFDPYFTTKQEGSGLGLAITHSIIASHDGHISAESKLGEGTTFTIFLPALKAKQPHKVTKEKEAHQIKALRILIMDDEEQIRELSEAMLSRLGHQVLLTKDGEEAIKVYEEGQSTGNPIDIVILDLTIPGGMGGKEAVQKILDLNPSAKVIVSSGYSNDPVMSEFRDYGFSAAISKPYQLKTFSRVIYELIGR